MVCQYDSLLLRVPQRITQLQLSSWKVLKAQYLLADKGYDTDAIVAQALQRDMKIVVPPKNNRKHQRDYGKYLYKLRHLVKNAFLHLKRWRGIATRLPRMLLRLPLLFRFAASLYG